MLTKFDLVDIKLFLSIAEASSLTKGAEKSFLSVPAASARIKNLEQNVGAKLLYRTNHGVSPTPVGQTILRHAQRLTQQIDEMGKELTLHLQTLQSQVRLLATPVGITEFLPGALRDFLAINPGISVDLRKKVSIEIPHEIRQGRADIGIISQGSDTEGMTVLPYREHSLVIVTAAGHPLAQKNTVSMRQAAAYDFIGYPEGSESDLFLLREAESLHLPLKIRIRLARYESMCEMVQANVGIALLPQCTATRLAKPMGLRVLRLAETWAARNLYICVGDLQALPSHARQLVDFLLMSDTATTAMV